MAVVLVTAMEVVGRDVVVCFVSARCRNDPYLMHVIKHYTKKSKLSPSFIEGWKHYKKVGLPPIP